MIGDRYWSAGIILKYGHSAWSAQVDFFDDGVLKDECTEGNLRTRYFVSIELAIDTVKADAERLGIEFLTPSLLGYCDGLSEDWPMPKGWRGLLIEQAERIGWNCHYQAETEIA
jgi:hypothetical protein